MQPLIAGGAIVDANAPGGGTYEVKTVQKWRKGDPWWYEARHYENGKPIGYEAVLPRQSKPPK
jgi:hypothetical protein